MSQKIQVAVVDDHGLMRQGITSMLAGESDIEVVGEFSSGEEAINFASKNLPNVILMDINLPDKSGIDLCQEVIRLYPSVMVIGLSTFNQQSFIQKMMDHGASGYVLKNASRQELLQAIETVMKGRTFMSDEAAQALVALGYTEADAAQVLRNIDQSLPVEERVRLALKGGSS